MCYLQKSIHLCTMSMTMTSITSAFCSHTDKTPIFNGFINIVVARDFIMHTQSVTRLTPSRQLDCSAERKLSCILKCIGHHSLGMLLTCQSRRGHSPALFLQKPKQKLWWQQCVLSHGRLLLLPGESQLDFHPAFTS